jgi:hypothetical protein
VLLHPAGVFRLEKRPPATGSTPEPFLGLQPNAAQALLAGKRCQQLLAAYKARLHSHLQQQGSTAAGVIDIAVASSLKQAGGLLDGQLQQYSDKVPVNLPCERASVAAGVGLPMLPTIVVLPRAACCHCLHSACTLILNTAAHPRSPQHIAIHP